MNSRAMAPYPTGWKRHRPTPLARALTALLVTLIVGSAHAQQPASDAKPPPLEPRDVEIETKDGVALRATWYASTVGEEAAPLILLHALHGNRNDFREFALYLQREKDFAVIVPDLRGHGESTQQELPTGEMVRLSDNRLRPHDFAAMAQRDVEAVKRLLIRHNNAGELNIERLGIVGAEMGALVAIEWAYQDWIADSLPTIKQGRDVRALALLSPMSHFKTLDSRWLTQPPLRGQIALQIIAGASDSDGLRDARSIYNLVRRSYLNGGSDEPAANQQDKLFFDVGYDTSLHGAKMLGKKLGLEERIARFFELQLVEPDLPWKERKSPL